MAQVVTLEGAWDFPQVSRTGAAVSLAPRNTQVAVPKSEFRSSIKSDWNRMGLLNGEVAFAGCDSDLLGRSWMRSIGHGVASAGRATGHVAAVTGREVGHVNAVVGRAVGHAVMEVGRGVRDLAKKVVRKVAKKMLLSGGADFMGASATTMSKEAAKGILIPTATAAVAAGTYTAPAAPIVPILVNEVVDEIYDQIKKKVAGGKTPEQALKEVDAEVSSDGDTSMGGSKTVLIVGGVGLALAALLLLRKK